MIRSTNLNNQIDDLIARVKDIEIELFDEDGSVERSGSENDSGNTRNSRFMASEKLKNLLKRD